MQKRSFENKKSKRKEFADKFKKDKNKNHK